MKTTLKKSFCNLSFVIARLLRWLKLDDIEYFDKTGMYLFGFEFAGGLSMIITGFLFSGLMSTINDTGYWWVSFIPFGLLIVTPPIIWIIGFIRAWSKSIVNK